MQKSQSRKRRTSQPRRENNVEMVMEMDGYVDTNKYLDEWNSSSGQNKESSLLVYRVTSLCRTGLLKILMERSL